VTNTGWVTTRHVVELIEKILKPDRRFEFWQDDAEFYRVAAKTPRSNCVMDTSKLLATGIRIRPVEEALEDSLRNWQPEQS
jgi:UDP-glucose 4,6-dehydratase